MEDEIIKNLDLLLNLEELESEEIWEEISLDSNSEALEKNEKRQENL